MRLISDLNDYFKDNRYQIVSITFFLILAYGYFITNWALSIDSEYWFRFSPFFVQEWIVQGRPFTWFLNVILNNEILPFWNDFLSICLLFLTAIFWSINLSKIKKNPRGMLLFSLLFTISPIYAFYLRFTTYNVSIGAGLLLISLAIYYLLDFRKHARLNSFYLCWTYLLLAILTYQMFAFYWITSIFLVVSYQYLAMSEDSDRFLVKKSILTVFYGFLLLFTALIFYKIILMIINHFVLRSHYIDKILQSHHADIIAQSHYTDNFFRWGKDSVASIISNLRIYFRSLLLSLSFNYSIILSIASSIIFLCCLVIKKINNLFFALLVFSFIISAFSMPLILGVSMPLRTMQSIPLMIAGVWLLIYSCLTHTALKKALFLLVIISVFFNAQYVVKIFYGDFMRFQYDINYANEVYDYLLLHHGAAIKKKPLAIIGFHTHPHTTKSVIIKRPYDTIGYSFFEWDGGNFYRMHCFMNWLGKDLIVPTLEQQESALKQSYDMGIFPSKNAVKETHELVILQLSRSQFAINQTPIRLNEAQYKKVDSSSISQNLDLFSSNSHQISVMGWGYFHNENAEETMHYIKFKSADHQYIFPANLELRPDVAKVFQNGVNLQQSGFNLSLNNPKLESGVYDVYLLLKNKQMISEIYLNKKIEI